MRPARMEPSRSATPARVGRLVALALLLPAVAQASEPIAWTAAEECIGRVCSVRGRVVEARDDGTAIRLYFDTEKRDVCVTLVRSWLVTWPDYAGREIVATGMVRRFRDVTEVTVLGPEEIALDLGEPTPAAEFESPEKRELEDLREEVRRLQKRMNELESR